MLLNSQLHELFRPVLIEVADDNLDVESQFHTSCLASSSPTENSFARSGIFQGYRECELIQLISS